METFVNYCLGLLPAGSFLHLALIFLLVNGCMDCL